MTDTKSSGYLSKSCSLFPLPYRDVSGTLEGNWRERWRTRNSHRRQNLRRPPLKCSLPRPPTLPTVSRPLPPSLCTWRSSGTSTCPWLTHSLSLLRLSWQSGLAPLVAGAHSPVATCLSEPPCPGVGPFMEGALPSPFRAPCRVNYRKGPKWGSGFSPGKLACSNPLSRPRERAGLFRSRAAWAQVTDSPWLRAQQVPSQSRLPPFPGSLLPPNLLS